MLVKPRVECPPPASELNLVSSLRFVAAVERVVRGCGSSGGERARLQRGEDEVKVRKGLCGRSRNSQVSRGKAKKENKRMMLLMLLREGGRGKRCKMPSRVSGWNMSRT